MKKYYIRTNATEDRPAMTCNYDFYQWIELCRQFRKDGIEFYAWVEVE